MWILVKMLKMKIALITMSYNHDKNGTDNALKSLKLISSGGTKQ